MSSTNVFRQIGLLIGLTASVAVGAAVVLWLWSPVSEGGFGSLGNERFKTAVDMLEEQKFGYRNTSLIPVNDVEEKLLTLSGAQLEYTQRLEASFTQRIERLLEPILGAESIRAQVTADIDFTSREQTLEKYKPDSLVLRNNEQEELVKEHEGAEKPDAQNIIRRQVNSYELDKTTSLTRSAIGRIDKLYIAVIVDDRLSRGVKGNTIRTPRTADELDRLTDLVKKAVGFNAKRGDIVSVIGASFKMRRSPTHQPYNNSAASPTWGQVWVKDLFNKALGILLILLLIFAVIRPAMKSLINLPADFTRKSPEGSAYFNSGLDNVGSDQGAGLSDINDSGSYERNMNTAARVVEHDPKLVAQIMKNWVSADGT